MVFLGDNSGKKGGSRCYPAMDLGSVLIFLSILSSVVSDDRTSLLELKKSISDPNGFLSSWNAGSFNYCSWFGVSCHSNFRVSGIKIGGNFSLSPSCSLTSELVLHGFGVERNCSDSWQKLGGKLSEVIGNLTKLRVLSVPFNGLVGEIPVGIWGLKDLQVLDLEGNGFHGNFSGFEFVGLRRLRVLNLAFNRVLGQFPVSLSKCRDLRVLNLAGNLISGVVPRFVGSFRKLKVLNLSFNRLVGYVPGDLGFGCRNLEHLDLSGNFLKGKIPRSLGECSHLRTLLLSSNALSGMIPNEFGRLHSLEVLDVSRNILGGTLPSTLGNCSCLSVLVLSNQFNDMLNKGGDPSCEVPHGRVSSAATARDECNSFEGPIPYEITRLPKLKIVWAPGANFGGELPSNWSSCKSLTMMNLAQNSFTGDIFNLFKGCNDLIYLNFSSNRLYGRLGGNLCLPCIPVLDLRSNLLSGLIPNVSTDICSNMLSFSRMFIAPFNTSTVYPMFYMHKALSQYTLPFSRIRPSMVHDFSQNMFSGAISALPCRAETGYTFLAGGNNLTGSLSEGAFQKCDAADLLIFNVSKNRIHGALPKAIGAQKSLAVLDMSWNNFTGSIPENLMDLRNLEVLMLSGNRLSGKIPSCLVKMVSFRPCNILPNELSTMQVTGKPGVNHSNQTLPKMHQHNSTMPPVIQSPPQSESKSKGDHHKNSLHVPVVGGVVAASAIAAILLAYLIIHCYRNRRENPSTEMVAPPVDTRRITVFTHIGVPLTYEAIIQATENFNQRCCIGTGGFGSTYRAALAPGTVVAVKRLNRERHQGVQEFEAEINTLGQIRHPNLITLIGYHSSPSDMFLIYNYLPGGNLERFIQERDSRYFDYPMLHKIALGIASALAFLHEQCQPRILHRDIKPSNILLDEESGAYLSDFGLSKILDPEATHATTRVAGTYGYIAPEYAMTGRVSNKSDVYSYGIMLLELMSDKRVLDPSFVGQENGFNIVSWTVMLLQAGNADGVFTAKLRESGPRDKLVKMLHVAVLCTLESITARPSMRQVVRRLNQIKPTTE